MKRVTTIHFTNGAGNNIFQYVFARLFAEAKGTELSHPALPVLGIPEHKVLPDPSLKTIVINGSSKHPANYLALLEPNDLPVNYELRVYPEDFRVYTPIINEIRSWFPSVTKTNLEDVVFHLRLGDRLIMKSTFKEENFINPEQYVKAINSFRAKGLHIVTDMPVWRKITTKDVRGFTFHRQVKPKDRVPPKVSADYFNDLYDVLNPLADVVRVGNTVKEDFDYIRSFDKILFQHGTLAWWAAALSFALDVAVYGRWRGGKSINLGWTDLPGWRQWGRATAPQHDLKDWHLRNIAQEYGLKTFVETGTRGGAALLALKDCFDKMYSVEIIEPAYRKVARKLAKYGHIRLYLGDSAKVLPEILKHVKKPTLFWLDAHDGRKSTPIMKELSIILSHDLLHHVLVIDDSRYFGTEKAYPSKEEIESLVMSLRSGAKVDYKFDAIRIWL